MEKDVSHIKSAACIQNAAEELQSSKQENIKIKATKIKKRICKMVNWKAPGTDGAHGY